MNNNQFKGIPFMQAELVRRYLSKSPATPKGRIHRPRKGLRSTHNKKKTRRERMQENDEDKNEPNIIPEEDEPHDGLKNVFLFCGAG